MLSPRLPAADQRFVYRVIEALADGGVKCGLPAEISLQFAAQMVLGAAQLTLESKLSPNELDQNGRHAGRHDCGGPCRHGKGGNGEES